MSVKVTGLVSTLGVVVVGVVVVVAIPLLLENLV
jgi:putative effector of murein hydrolase